MAKPDYETLKARVLAQIPVKHVSAPRHDAPFSTYVKYGKRMLEYMAAKCEIDEAFLLTHEQYQAPKLARAQAIRLVEWRLENIADAEWSEPPRQGSFLSNDSALVPGRAAGAYSGQVIDGHDTSSDPPYPPRLRHCADKPA